LRASLQTPPLHGYFGDKDPTSRRVMGEILAKEEEHAEDMRTLTERVGKDTQ
jgi:bacterioferritin